jgi:fermentation-respiration switch protein FrsA (DUF1100 family)
MRTIATVIIAAVLGYVTVVVLSMFLEESLVYFPSRYPEGDWKPLDLRYEDAEFTAADGVRLHGWYLPHPQPLASVLFCHGNAGNITHRAELLWMLQNRVGVSVLIFDYRGYGRSEGSPTEAGILADARAARAWLAAREGIAESQIVMMGESLGGGVAVALAAADGARALVLQKTFTSLPDVAAYHFPWLPVRWLMRNRLDSLSKIGNYRGPLLMCHGRPDTIVPYELGRRLFEAANEPKHWIGLPGHNHNDPLPSTYFEQLKQFLAGLPPPGE